MNDKNRIVINIYCDHNSDDMDDVLDVRVYAAGDTTKSDEEIEAEHRAYASQADDFEEEEYATPEFLASRVIEDGKVLEHKGRKFRFRIEEVTE